MKIGAMVMAAVVALFGLTIALGSWFTVDQTDFTGVLKVTDHALFIQAMSSGIGSTARAFGFGMINL